MAVGKDKTRLNIILTKDLKAELEKEAKMEQRQIILLIYYKIERQKINYI